MHSFFYKKMSRDSYLFPPAWGIWWNSPVTSPGVSSIIWMAPCVIENARIRTQDQGVHHNWEVLILTYLSNFFDQFDHSKFFFQSNLTWPWQRRMSHRCWPKPSTARQLPLTLTHKHKHTHTHMHTHSEEQTNTLFIVFLFHSFTLFQCISLFLLEWLSLI